MGSYCTSKDSDLRTPHDFFNAAYEAGYRIVVASFRENQLARDVSSYKNDWAFINVRLGQVIYIKLHCAHVLVFSISFLCVFVPSSSHLYPRSHQEDTRDVNEF